MLIELICSGVVIGGAIALAARKGNAPLLLPTSHPKEEEYLSFSAKLRRAQQALKRHGNHLSIWENQLAHDSKELSLSNQLLDVREKGIDVEGKLVALREIGLDYQDRENKINHDNRLIEIAQQQLGISKQELDLIAKENNLTNKEELLKLIEVSLQQQAKEVDLKDQASKNSHDNRLLNILSEQLKLRKTELDINDYDNVVRHRERMVELGEKSLNVKAEELQHAYNVKAFQLQNMLQDIRHQFKDLELEKKSFSLFQERGNLDLYRQRLQNLDAHINQMYEVKMNWLRIEAKENNLSLEKEQMKLQRLYDSTQNKLQQLSITRREVDHHWDKKALEHRNNVLKFISQQWLK